VFNRVDVARIASQLPYEVAPVSLVSAEDQTHAELPTLDDVPDLDDEGPHLAYAVQWFGFAIVGVVGFFFLARRKGGSSG
jgi:surfeit locus 1 family protein